jgi:hypothetical protein
LRTNGCGDVRVQKALEEDAKDYYFSGLLSFVEALRGPPCGLSSWATVKLYYSVFYTLRAILALNEVAIFYPDNELLAFDSEHAMIAYPLLAIRMAKQHCERHAVDPLRNIDREAIEPHCNDRSGPLPPLLRILHHQGASRS